MKNLIPAIVLVRPQMGENIGMCARAMLNCGLTDLRLVNPRDGWPSDKAESASAGALAHINVTIYHTLAEAIADCGHVYATSGKSKQTLAKAIFTPEGCANEIHARAAADEMSAILFGCERSGLDNDELAQAHSIVTIPANPDFTSFNISQALLLMGYAWLRAKDETPAKLLHRGDSPAATHAEMENLIGRLFNELEEGGFFPSPALRPTTERNIRASLYRAEMSQQEANTFQGMITALIGRKKRP